MGEWNQPNGKKRIGSIFLAPYMDATFAEFYAELLNCHGIVISDGAQDAEITSEQAF